MANNTGVKTGGRQKGTPNKATQTVLEILNRYNHDPIVALIKIAQDKSNDVGLRAKVNNDLASFIYPKRKSLEVKDDSKPVHHNYLIINNGELEAERARKAKLAKLKDNHTIDV